MIVYYIPILSILFLNYLYNDKLDLIALKGLQYCIIFLAFFIFCGGYMTGSDWRNYELIYNSITINQAFQMPKEQLFYIYMAIFKYAKIEFFPFLIISKAIIFFLLINSIIKISQDDNFALFIFFGYYYFSLFIFVDNPLRFMMALGIVSISFNKIVNNKPFQFIIIIILAALFHISALIMFPVYLIRKINFPKIVLIVLFSVYYIIFSPNVILKILQALYNIFPIFILLMRSYILKMKNLEYNLLSIGLIYNYIIIILIIIYSDEIRAKPNGDFKYAMTIIYFVLFKLGSVVPTISRLNLLFMPFYISSVCSLLKSIQYKKIFEIILIVYISLATYETINQSYVYIPYSNYFLMLGKSEIPYSIRTEFNKKYYYEKYGKMPEDWHEGIDYSQDLLQ